MAIALHKLNKPDYSNLPAYCLIVLLECLRKVLEKVVATRLTFIAGKEGLNPDQHFSGRSNYSADDVILSFINDIQAAWNHRMATSALTFDIKGYFDFANHNWLLTEMRQK